MLVLHLNFQSLEGGNAVRNWHQKSGLWNTVLGGFIKRWKGFHIWERYVQMIIFNLHSVLNSCRIKCNILDILLKRIKVYNDKYL